MKPLIGITTFDEMKDGIKGMYSIVHKRYADSVILAGGIPVLIPLNENIDGIKELVNRLDGVILTGGNEYIQPHLYGRNSTREITEINPIRDLVELEVLKEAYEQNKTVLGICRGMQLINTFFKGDLYLNVYNEVENVECHMANGTQKYYLYHDVNLVKDSYLEKILNKDKIGVNTFHTQAVRNLGKDLKVSAISNDKIIEALEHKNNNIFAVQWHPEALTEKYNDHLEIFKFFVKRCGANEN